MTEHQQLKEICDKIGFDFQILKWSLFWNGKEYTENKDVREIIFNKEFIEKFEKYLQNTEYKEMVQSTYTNAYITYFRAELITNLDNPVEYLYNLIK
jgi:hypothetical protein